MLITVNHSQNPVKEIHLDKNRVIIGRGANCDVVVDSDHLSRQHLEIEFKNGDLLARDMTLSSWVSLNQEKLSKSELTLYHESSSLVLPSGHEIQIKLTTETTTPRKKDIYTEDENKLHSVLKFAGALLALGAVIGYIAVNF